MDDIDFDIASFEIDLPNEDLTQVKFNTGIKKKLKKNNQPVIVRSLVKRINQKSKIPKSKILEINSKSILEYIPNKGETTFFVMDGNCVFLDFVLAMVQEKQSLGWKLKSIYLTSLSLNQATFDKLNSRLQGVKINLLISSYWLTVDKSGILDSYYRQNKLTNYKIGYYRNHTKIILLEFINQDQTESYTLSGSANLRSSNTLEQFVIIEDQDILEFNKAWIDSLISSYRYDFEVKNDFNTPSNF